MATNKLIGTRWYVDENGVRKKASEAPASASIASNGSSVNSKTLLDASGKPAVNAWVKKDGKTYYAGSDSMPLTGLQTIGGKQYIFDEWTLKQKWDFVKDLLGKVIREKGKGIR